VTAITNNVQSGDFPYVELREGGVELLEKLAPEWRQLCDEGPIDQPFYRPEWLTAYLKFFEPETGLIIVSARLQGRLTAVLPFVKEKIFVKGFPVARVLAGAHSRIPDRFDLARSAGKVGDNSVKAIWNFLGRLEGWDIIQLPCVPEGGAAEQLVESARSSGFMTVSEEALMSPFISLRACERTLDPFSLIAAGKRRSELRRQRKKLEQTAGLRFVRIDRPQLKDIERYYELELAGWKGRNGTSVASKQHVRRFYDEITRKAMESSYLVLSFLKQGDQTVSAQLDFRYRNRLFCFECAYSDAYAPYSPGYLLFSDILRDCACQGLSEIDFTGKQTSQSSFWTSRAHLYKNHYIFQKGIYGSLLAKAKFRVKPFIKKILGKIHG